MVPREPPCCRYVLKRRVLMSSATSTRSPSVCVCVCVCAASEKPPMPQAKSKTIFSAQSVLLCSLA
eukprot:6859934-Prorocentrum_lima.AAC.1